MNGLRTSETNRNKELGLEIVAECNLRIVNYLDVTLNLNNGSFKPYHKPDNIIQYINK